MATYLIGDVHGCYDELIALLHKVEFTPGKDTLWLTGDLVARGPGSLDVLRYVKSLGDSVRLVLGNHDLHLLAVFAGISRNKPKDRLTPLLGRLRFITNAFTRMRFCFPNGQLDMYSKESPEEAPAPLKPWFAIPGPVAEEYSIAFGHWASLEGKGTPEGIYALDTGCCWGGTLTCLRWEDKQYFVQPSNRHKDLGEAAAS